MAETGISGKRRGGNGGRLAILGIVMGSALALAAARPAAAWTVDGNAPRADFEAFSRRFASDAYFYPGHGAAPLGLVGFNVFAEGSYDGGFGSESFADSTVR